MKEKMDCIGLTHDLPRSFRAKLSNPQDMEQKGNQVIREDIREKREENGMMMEEQDEEQK